MRKRCLWVVGAALLMASCGDDTEPRKDGAPPDLKKKQDGVAPDMPYPMGLLSPAPRPERLAMQADGELDFRWEGTPGPAKIDLSLGDSNAPLFQVFARDGRPFARAGMRVVPLEARATYKLKLRTTGQEMHLALIHLTSGRVSDLGTVARSGGALELQVRRTQIHASVPGLALALR